LKKNKHNKKHIQTQTKKEEKTEESEFNFKIPKINTTYLKYIIPAIFLIICLSLSIYLRVQPAYLPATENWAENSIKQNLKYYFEQEINQKYPNLPVDEKNKIINEEINKYFINNKEQIKEGIKEQSEFFKTHFTHEKNDIPYLIAIDPWYFYYHTKNYLEFGNQYGITEDEAENGYYYALRGAGTPIDTISKSNKKVIELHVYFSAFVYKIAKFFNEDISLLKVLFFVPVIIGTLMIIPGFFLARKFAGDLAGLFAGIIIAVHPSILTRTIGGFNDTDGYQILFPLFAIWFLFEAYNSNNIKYLSIWSILAGLSIGLFAFAWSGWSFIFLFLILTSIAILLYKILINYEKIIKFNLKEIYKKIKLNLYAFVIFILSSAIFITIFKSFSSLNHLISKTYRFLFEYKATAITTIWPNVFTTVAELNPIGANAVLTQISINNPLLLFLSLIGIFIPLIYFKKEKKLTDWLFLGGASLYYIIIQLSLNQFSTAYLLLPILISIPIIAYVLYNIIKKEDIDVKFSAILLLYYGAIIYSGQNGIRFVLLLVPAFALSTAITLGFLFKIISNFASKTLELNKHLSKIIVGILLLLVLIIPINVIGNSNNIAKNMVPSMNDGWYNALDKINNEASSDAIINSWWDFGHWFIAIGQRRTTFDGAMQNTPQAHWMGKSLITSNPNESVGILRYLSCGANHGYNLIKDYTNNDTYGSVQLLYKIIPENRKDALKILKDNNLSEENAKNILKYTHCDNLVENYYITSEDMVGKGGVWGHFGSWNFTKASMYNRAVRLPQNEAIKLLQKDFGLTESVAKRYVNEIKTQKADNWISPWPGYLGSSNCQKLNETHIFCENGIIFDLEKEEIMPINLGDNVKRYPKTLLYISEKENKTKTKEYPNEEIITLQNGREVGLAIYKEGNNYKSALMDDELTQSMFTRLFFFENYNNELEYFEMFYKTTTITGEKIIIWKINWDKYKEKINY
jgi:dolichyl-phosphooligosaccharide-protein glycotransferase